MKRISWKRGMRLTDELLRTSDECTAQTIGHALVLAAAGRFGLLPSAQPFSLALNIVQNVVDVESLSCTGITRDGHLVDAHYDTRFTNNYDTRVIIPDVPGATEYFLTVNAGTGQWAEQPDGLEEPIYTFALVGPDTAIADNALPIARIVDDNGWRHDEVEFVPPCLFVSAHYKYGELLKQFADLLAVIDTRAHASLAGAGRSAVSIFWPLVQQIRIAVSKECDLMTPMTLLSNVQKCVGAFTCACDLDPTLELKEDESKQFHYYVQAPYSFEDAYIRIKRGLEICYAISEKVPNLKPVDEPQPEPVRPAPRQEPNRPAAPFISQDQLHQECKTADTSIRLVYEDASATIFFTTDGRLPNARSAKAVRDRKTGEFIVRFKNGYPQKMGAEPDRTVTMKLVAVVSGVSSNVSAYQLLMHKSLKFSDARPI